MAFTVAGYELAADRRYDPVGNLWVAQDASRRVRIGLDPLGAETAGDIVAISFVAPGTRLERGASLATIEAAKFVGPIASPVGGTVHAVNDALLADPGAINSDPLGSWLVELDGVDAVELEQLLAGEEAIAGWFAGAVERFRREGALAE
jgi:glycine cleavage system H protein